MNEDAPVTGLAGAEGLTHRQLMEEIGRGGRFVTFLYAISVVVMTFRRSTNVRFYRAGETTGASAWGPTLLTLIVGWWGFPWGPIFSIQSIFRNAIGGKDVTEALLTPVVGAERAKAALKLRPKAKAGVGLWSLRATLLAFPLAVFGMFSLAEWQETSRVAQLQHVPGYEAWHNADIHLGGQADGNGTQARNGAIALKTLLDASVRMESRSGTAKAPKPFGVWCQFAAHDAVVLVQWDDLWRLSIEDRAEMESAIWQAACAATRGEPERGDGSTLTVGLKDKSAWKSALFGKMPATDHARESKPAESITRDVRTRLVAAFAPAVAH